MEKLTTIVSTKGQVILPKTIRQQRQWDAGTRLVVEDTADGVLLRAVPDFPATEPKDVYGILAHNGPSLSIDEMEEAILAEARRQHAGA